ncbi:hypothetical protein HPB48_006360 [Haemaphysalis longicornis]|uniref:Uncharacterized protein n=1 Tax=Haemaphysalis longicornis TaxID=44386 RepID=A0A9J6FAE6_HAELO|nr:hypothetical protein HPB48_006360 [Haemaphysalis longicornis]
MAPRTRDEDQVHCQECLRWCYLGETEFEHVADAKKAPFECRPCERTRQGFERLEKQCNAKVEELEGYLREEREARMALEARVAELDKAGQAKTTQLVRTMAKLGEARERQAQLEKRVEELVTPAVGDDSFNLGRATANILVDCIEKSVADLPRNKFLCFFSDGPNTMKSVKTKLKQGVCPNLLDIGECNLHKVHNAFGTGLNSFGSDVELMVLDVYYYFKHAVRSSNLKEHQKELGIQEHVFLWTRRQQMADFSRQL